VKKWLLLSGSIIVAMIVALVVIVQAFTPTPIPDPPTIPDGPLAIHINEIDLSTTGMMLISIDNLTGEDITIDATRLGEALNGHLRLFDSIGNEWIWVDATGQAGLPFAGGDSNGPWRGSFNASGNASGSVRIEPGRTENFNLIVNNAFGLTAQAWAARFRAQPDRLIYVLDSAIPTIGDPTGSQALRVTAKGEAAYLPRP